MTYESIEVLFETHVNSDYYNDRTRPEEEVAIDGHFENIEKALSPEAYKAIISDLETMLYLKEQLGFTDGFRYSHKLASESL